MTLSGENVSDYAETLVLQVKNGGRTLDYSEASVAIIEGLLRVSDELLRGENFPDAQRNLVMFYNGCYLGEVMARHLGGVWRFEPDWFDASLVFAWGEEGGLQVRPFHKLFRRVSEGLAGNDLVAYYDGLKTKLAEQNASDRSPSLSPDPSSLPPSPPTLGGEECV